MSEQLKVGDLTLEVRRSQRRKTVDLIVDRGGQLVALIPIAMTDEQLADLVKKKSLWIYSTLAKKEGLLHEQAVKEFVSGEGFLYLGHSYRLKVVQAPGGPSPAQATLQLKEGRFLLRADLVPQGREVFLGWYRDHAVPWLTNRIETLKRRVGTMPTGVDVRDLGFRWSSCNKAGQLFFHWRVILLPPERIDYLILHELVHLIHHNHGPEFYARLRQAAPDYLEQEQWLAENGDLYRI